MRISNDDLAVIRQAIGDDLFDAISPLGNGELAVGVKRFAQISRVGRGPPPAGEKQLGGGVSDTGPRTVSGLAKRGRGLGARRFELIEGGLTHGGIGIAELIDQVRHRIGGRDRDGGQQGNNGNDGGAGHAGMISRQRTQGRVEVIPTVGLSDRVC